jgi:hypothetical protein
MKEIVECYKVDTINLQRNDGFWLNEGRLVLRSVNVGELVEDRYQSPYAEARFSLSEADTKSMMLLLDADADNFSLKLKQLLTERPCWIVSSAFVMIISWFMITCF